MVFDFIEEVGGGIVGADDTTVGWLDEQSGWFVDHEQVVVFVQQMSLDVNVEFPCKLKVRTEMMTEAGKAGQKSAHASFAAENYKIARQLGTALRTMCSVAKVSAIKWRHVAKSDVICDSGHVATIIERCTHIKDMRVVTALFPEIGQFSRLSC